MVVLVVIAALLAASVAGGWLLSVIDPPPTSRSPDRASPRTFPGVDTEGGGMEPAPRRLANWLLASKSITRGP